MTTGLYRIGNGREGWEDGLTMVLLEVWNGVWRFP